MRKLQIVCGGMFPIMMDRMPEAVLDSLATGARLQIKKDRPHEEVAEEKIYRDEEGRIGLPVTMLYAALVTAGRDVSYKGRQNISTAETTKLFGLMEISEEFLLFPVPEGTKETPWIVDKRPGRLPKDGTAVCLRRPKFKNWNFTCTVIFDEKLIDQSKILELFYQAGKFQGLGSFRPNCKGPFGRFVVDKVNDITPEDWKKQSGKKSAANTDVPDEPINIDEDGDGELVSVGGNGDGKPRKGRLARTNA